jgi:hypothetical protein
MTTYNHKKTGQCQAAHNWYIILILQIQNFNHASENCNNVIIILDSILTYKKANEYVIK